MYYEIDLDIVCMYWYDISLIHGIVQITTCIKWLCLFTVLCSLKCLSVFIASLSYLGWQSSIVAMTLFKTVSFPSSVLDLGTVKRPLVACIVLYLCVSELCANCLNRQFGTFNTSIPCTKTNMQSISPQLWVWYALLCSGPTAIYLCPSLSQMTTHLDSSPGVTKLGPVGPVWSTELSRRQRNTLSSHFSHLWVYMFRPWQLAIYTQQFSLLNLLNSRIIQ